MPERAEIEAVEVIRRALRAAQEHMRDTPGIDPMRSLHAREIRDGLDALSRVSPQDEDHEAEAVAALYEFAREQWGWGSEEYESVRDAVDVVLSRSSPSRDGTVAVEGPCPTCGGRGRKAEAARSPQGEDREAPEFDEQAITDILVAIDDTLWGCGRERMDLTDGPTVDALRDAVKRELVAFVDRSSPSRDGTVAEIVRRLRYSDGIAPDAAVREIADWIESQYAVARDGTVAVEDVAGKAARIIADLIEGETADEGTPQWYALRNARGFLAEFGSARAGESNEGGNR